VPGPFTRVRAPAGGAVTESDMPTEAGELPLISGCYQHVGGVLNAIAWDPSVFDGAVSYQGYTSATNSVFATWATSITIRDLVVNWCAVEPGGTYTFTVQAIGENNYLSEHSAPLTATIPLTVS